MHSSPTPEISDSLKHLIFLYIPGPRSQELFGLASLPVVWIRKRVTNSFLFQFTVMLARCRHVPKFDMPLLAWRFSWTQGKRTLTLPASTPGMRRATLTKGQSQLPTKAHLPTRGLKHGPGHKRNNPLLRTHSLPSALMHASLYLILPPTLCGGDNTPI